MSTMIMNMSQGNIERDEPVTAEYGDEVMCSGWNPMLALAQLVPEDKRRAFPAELADVDIESFLHKMYV
jgi:hypothetical protein